MDLLNDDEIALDELDDLEIDIDGWDEDLEDDDLDSEDLLGTGICAVREHLICGANGARTS
jgi:hypothetical protein